MPTRGYRKGQSDSKEPLPRQIYTRTSVALHDALHAEAQHRNLVVSALVRKILEAHAKQTRAELPRQQNGELLRELCRIGNNLNQLARQANRGLVQVQTQELQACLDHLNDLARRHR